LSFFTRKQYAAKNGHNVLITNIFIVVRYICILNQVIFFTAKNLLPSVKVTNFFSNSRFNFIQCSIRRSPYCTTCVTTRHQVTMGLEFEDYNVMNYPSCSLQEQHPLIFITTHNADLIVVF